MSCPASILFFFFYWYGPHRALHSFPTRRSSDLKDNTLHVAGRTFHEKGESLRAVSRIERQAVLGGETARRLSPLDRKSTRLNSSHITISYAVFCLKKKKTQQSACAHTLASRQYA